MMKTLTSISLSPRSEKVLDAIRNKVFSLCAWMYNLRMKKLPNAILLLLGLAGFAFGGSTPYFAVAHVRKGKDFHFPILNVRRNSRVETKINQLLQLSEFTRISGSKKARRFRTSYYQ